MILSHFPVPPKKGLSERQGRSGGEVDLWADAVQRRDPLWAPVRVPAAPLITQLPADVPGKAECGSCAWALALEWEIGKKFLPPGIGLAQPWLSWSFGE